MLVGFDIKNMKTFEENYNSLFVKIPNGIIDLSNSLNSYLSLTYLFLAINKNMLGKVNSSILFLEECFADNDKENQKTKSEKIDKILSSLYLLSNTIVNKKKEIVFDSVIDIPKYGDYFNHCEFEINTCSKKIEEEKIKLYKQYQKFPNYTLSVVVDNENISNNFTVLSINDYLLIMDYCLKRNIRPKPKVDTFLNTYLLIKMLINRRKALNKSFPNGWKYRETVTLKELLKKTNLSSTTLRKYLEMMIELNLIEKSIYNKQIIYKLKELLKENIKEKDEK